MSNFLRWVSLSRWLEEPEREPRPLSAWPIARSPRWTERVNRPLTAAELKAVRNSVNRGSPFGDENWVQAIARHLNLQSTLHRLRKTQKMSPDTFSSPRIPQRPLGMVVPGVCGFKQLSWVCR
jgi:putative transposase